MSDNSGVFMDMYNKAAESISGFGHFTRGLSIVPLVLSFTAAVLGAPSDVVEAAFISGASSFIAGSALAGIGHTLQIK